MGDTSPEIVHRIEVLLERTTALVAEAIEELSLGDRVDQIAEVQVLYQGDVNALGAIGVVARASLLSLARGLWAKLLSKEIRFGRVSR